MKKLVCSVISLIMLSPVGMASSSLVTELVIAKPVTKIELKDGRLVDMTNVRTINMHQSTLDYLQLNNGEIVDKSDLWAIKPVKADDLSIALAKAIKAMASSHNGDAQGFHGVQSIDISNGRVDTILWDNGSTQGNFNVEGISQDFLLQILIDGMRGVDGGG